MATQAPSAPEKVQPQHTPSPQPPDDSIWTRYSPHGEAPLSGVGSFALHALGIGLIIILGIFVYAKDKKAENLPVDMVRLDVGGGGRGAGRGIGDRIGDGSDTEDGQGKGDGSVEKGDPEDGKLTLNPEEMQALPPSFKDDPDAARAIQKGNPNVKGLASLNQSARDKLRTGINPGGNGGKTGDGGISGGNDGDGSGGKKGLPPSVREKRMFRWRINFDRTLPAAYIDQLASAGAIVGVPTDREGKSYRAIRELRKRPAPMTNEDPLTLGFICWFNNDPVWAGMIMRELGVNLTPTHFAVFFPRELEEKFVTAEVKYRGHKESEIAETVFRLKRIGNRFEPEVITQTLK
jgi:hypothetical protein